MTEKTLVMVLGMHRSGTSAITKGLETLGVSLSENILPESDTNKKGYWEDIDVLTINEKLLHYAGLEWDSPVPFPTDKLEEPFCQALVDETVSLLKRKMSDHQLWGFKDPRSSRLLPFWLLVFERAGIKPKFILSIRNPVDVAHSLKKRNEFDYLHSYYLWLLHVLPNLEFLIKFDYAIVDFSALLAMPEKSMRYIAERLKLSVDENRLSEFSKSYLDSSLCHSSSKISDLIVSTDSSDLLVNTYKNLLVASLDIKGIDELSSKNIFPELMKEFEDSQYVFLSNLLVPLYKKYWELLHEKHLLAKSCNELGSDNQNLLIKVNHLDEQLAHASNELNASENENQNLLVKVNHLDEQLAHASNELNVSENENQNLHVKVNHLDEQLAHASNELSASENENQNLLVKVHHLDEQLAHASNELNASEGEKQNLLVNVNNLQAELNTIHTKVNLIYQSTSWKITRPLRTVKRLISGDWRAIQDGLHHHAPMLTHAFNPVAGGFSARLRRAISLLVRKGPNAFLRKIKTVTNRHESSSVTPSPASLSEYQTWLFNHQDQEQSDATKLFELLPKMRQPLISIVMPTYNTDEKFLRLCIESVLNQSYQNWELCIADDASPDPLVVKVLTEYQAKDKRVKVICRQENGHISAATNSALELVTGEWVALLDHDDELHRDALLNVAKAINEKPETELIYSDEDKIDEQGNRISPHFKSDWNLDLLYSQNYVSHLGVYRADIVKKIGGFRLGYEGSQDFDLLLRYSREINHKNIIHIPKVLYHWRMVSGSTALATGEKSYTTEAGIKALQDHFNALGKDVAVEQGKHDNIYKVNWILANEALVSLIIPTYNGYEITKQAIDSILEKTTYQNYEILLVDNNSNDPIALEYFEELDKHDKVTVLRYPYPFNYSAINNFAAKQAKGEIIGLINNDIEVINPEWLTEMVSHAQREDIGCVGAMLYYPNDTIQHAGVVIGIGGVGGHAHKHFKRDDYGYFSRLKVVQNYSAVTAACLLVKKDIFNEVNGLNEQDLTIAFNDVDFCLKVQAAGYRNLWTPYAELYHHESISRGAEDNPEKIARFNKEIEYMLSHWKTDQISDFAYNPNLTIDHENFSLDWSFRYSVKN